VEKAMTLTKADIADTISGQVGYTKRESLKIVDQLFEYIKNSLESGEDVLISGFGKFSVKDKRARKGRNPQTGDPILLSPRKVVTFKYSGKLRDVINDEV
jgi:integration host factor subunit alpha